MAACASLGNRPGAAVGGDVACRVGGGATAAIRENRPLVLASQAMRCEINASRRSRRLNAERLEAANEIGRHKPSGVARRGTVDVLAREVIAGRK